MIEIRGAVDDDVTALSALFVRCVLDGASMGYLDDVDEEEATAFWRRALAEQDAGRRVVLVATDAGGVVGTASVVLSFPPNQPHRGEVVKLMVDPAQRGEGTGRALLAAVEDAAWSAGRTLLVLDTETGSTAEGFYAAAGWTKVGEIPDYALTPDRRLHATSLFWKRRPAPPG